MSAQHAPGQEHVICHADGSKSVSFDGARLELRADGSHRWANVKDDSPLYAAMNSAAIAKATGSAS